MRRPFPRRQSYYAGLFSSDEDTVYDSEDDISLIGPIENRGRRMPFGNIPRRMRDRTVSRCVYTAVRSPLSFLPTDFEC